MISIDRDIVVDYDDLLAEHHEIDTLSQELARLVCSERPDTCRVADLLCSLAIVVAAHMRKEESFIYPGLAGVTAAAETKSAVAEFEALKTNWERYVDTWQQENVLSDWQAFATETLEALKVLSDQAMGEVASLYAMGVRKGLVRLHSETVDI